MKLIIQTKTPFIAGNGEMYACISGDMLVDDSCVYFWAMNSTIPVIVRREDIAFAAVLPNEMELNGLPDNGFTFVADPIPAEAMPQ